MRNIMTAAFFAFIMTAMPDAHAREAGERTTVLVSAQVAQVTVRERVIGAAFVRPPADLVQSPRLVLGPCLMESRSNWINGARVETRSGLCRWSDGTIRPTR